MATGKTNSRWYRLCYGGYDLSGDARTVGGFGAEFGEEDVTGWSDGVINFNMGRPRLFIEGFQAVFNNTAATGSHTVLSTLLNSYASMFVGIRAAPAVGDPTFSIPLQQSAYTSTGDGPVLVNVNAVVGQTGLLSLSGLSIKPFGVALAVGASLTSNTNGTSVDNGASSANGCVAYLHITASSGGTWALTLQDSTDNSYFADLITFTANGSAITAEQGTATGTVDRYVRFRAVRTSGSFTAWVTFIRL